MSYTFVGSAAKIAAVKIHTIYIMRSVQIHPLRKSRFSRLEIRSLGITSAYERMLAAATRKISRYTADGMAWSLEDSVKKPFPKSPNILNFNLFYCAALTISFSSRCGLAFPSVSVTK